MSLFSVDMQAGMAAARCGAKREVWTAVHVHHGLRTVVAVDTNVAHIGGRITGISDKGFTIGGTHKVSWADAIAVVPTEVRP